MKDSGEHLKWIPEPPGAGRKLAVDQSERSVLFLLGNDGTLYMQIDCHDEAMMPAIRIGSEAIAALRKLLAWEA